MRDLNVILFCSVLIHVYFNFTAEITLIFSVKQICEIHTTFDERCWNRNGGTLRQIRILFVISHELTFRTLNYCDRFTVIRTCASEFEIMSILWWWLISAQFTSEYLKTFWLFWEKSRNKIEKSIEMCGKHTERQGFSHFILRKIEKRNNVWQFARSCSSGCDISLKYSYTKTYNYTYKSADEEEEKEIDLWRKVHIGLKYKHCRRNYRRFHISQSSSDDATIFSSSSKV